MGVEVLSGRLSTFGRLCHPWIITGTQWILREKLTCSEHFLSAISTSFKHEIRFVIPLVILL
jgi:hypothetical protein